MRKIVNSTFVSLDGVINHMERWHFDFIDDEMNALARAQLDDSDALLLGRHTYDAYASAWPNRDDDYAARINAMTKYVVSTTMQTATWQNTAVLAGDLVGEVTRLKAGSGKNILMHGYGPVAKTLMRNGLLDELCLWVHPVLAGVGTADDLLMSHGLHARLQLTDVRTLDSGVVLLGYRAAS
jgi:dihydrofolate reductase